MPSIHGYAALATTAALGKRVRRLRWLSAGGDCRLLASYLLRSPPYVRCFYFLHTSSMHVCEGNCSDREARQLKSCTSRAASACAAASIGSGLDWIRCCSPRTALVQSGTALCLGLKNPERLAAVFRVHRHLSGGRVWRTSRSIPAEYSTASNHQCRRLVQWKATSTTTTDSPASASQASQRSQRRHPRRPAYKETDKGTSPEPLSDSRLAAGPPLNIACSAPAGREVLAACLSVFATAHP